MSYPLFNIEWEPHGDGTLLILRGESFPLNQISVRELRDDMEEAEMLSRGYEMHNIFTEEVQPRDKVRVLSHNLTVASVLTERNNRTVLQFADLDGEIVLPSDEQITVYRAIE